MKKTPLHHIHETLGARMAEFGGWCMPIHYAGIIAEHRAVRTHAGIFDISHMGEFFVEGPDAERFLNWIVTNDAAKMTDGRVMYTPICNERGGVVDDILIYRFSPARYMLVVNASNTRKDFDWLQDHRTTYDVQIHDKTDEYALIAVQGPESANILQPLVSGSLNDMHYYWFKEMKFQDMDSIVSRTGYTGEYGFELYVRSADAEKIWRTITGSKEANNLLPVGLGARDSLRLEASLPLYGHELADDITPFEAGLDWVVRFDKKSFIGKEALSVLRGKDPERYFVCLLMQDKGIPRQGYEIIEEQMVIGSVASGIFSPHFNKGIAMGYATKKLNAGHECAVQIRGQLHPCAVVPRPFYKKIEKQKIEVKK